MHKIFYIFMDFDIDIFVSHCYVRTILVQCTYNLVSRRDITQDVDQRHVVGRLEPVQRRLVTLATREGVVFGVETREGGPAKTTLLYVLARTCTGEAEGARCTCNGAR